ncbi:phosphoribosylanthranilate isomerase [Mucilaginibacter ginkgonis]|uniref:N-(5'-phosphoribosyl)anthranilate isomerase n=1 Tax=Mucilaginibacter ginkgonis TaxID=2682091 RepID=A0A6I4I068_9SPHI|nr:phosphoribosylanthranilate isomerase [Mucilaginibacter ginkgonis]QQL50962.1 phosphoribosylanthranilate isomerase [Mucilaginibacter ginkgonis]
MKIKVCGLKDPNNIKAIEALGPDFIGLIFYPRSPRYIDGLPSSVTKAISPAIVKTGVFVNDSFESINSLISEYELDAVQLHGVENPEFCAGLKKRVKVIKAFNIDEEFDFDDLDVYLPHVDYFLFDTRSNKPGGSGLTFDWSVLKNYTHNAPFFLSGGLSLDNLEAALKISHPQFYAVDLNSKFEISPGIKDAGKLKEAFNLIRRTV